MQNVISMLSYENGVSSLEWLKKAFGFEENMEMRFVEDGRLTHSELKAGENIIMIATPSVDYESINKQRKSDKQMDKWLSVPWVVNGLLVYVENVEEYFKNAEESGAEILSEIEEDFPGKRYRCADIEGHRWMFMQKK
ncbi:MAG TPA: VOC family protein [Hanamia sp.]